MSGWLRRNRSSNWATEILKHCLNNRERPLSEMNVNFTFEKAKFDRILHKAQYVSARVVSAPHLALISYSSIFPKANLASMQFTHIISNLRDNPPPVSFKRKEGRQFWHQSRASRPGFRINLLRRPFGSGAISNSKIQPSSEQHPQLYNPSTMVCLLPLAPRHITPPLKPYQSL